jgi:hypothetical protein
MFFFVFCLDVKNVNFGNSFCTAQRYVLVTNSIGYTVLLNLTFKDHNVFKFKPVPDGLIRLCFVCLFVRWSDTIKSVFRRGKYLVWTTFEKNISYFTITIIYTGIIILRHFF